MMQYFHFQRLINKYSSTFTAEYTEKGEYNKQGVYEDGKTVTKELTGAILSIRAQKIFRSEGTLTTQDRQLYMTEPLDRALLGAIVTHEGMQYRVQEETENAEFTGVYAYILKANSAFNKGGST